MGRPKGSKNKPKEDTEETVVKQDAVSFVNSASDDDPNMDLWNRQRTSKEKYLKPANLGRFKVISIVPQHQLENATREWGSYGDRWGLKNLKFSLVPEYMEQYSQDHLKDVRGKDLRGQDLVLEATFFYPLVGEDRAGTAEFPIAVSVKHIPGYDQFKILLTDARSKALSLLGFNADVFLGEHDHKAKGANTAAVDNKYAADGILEPTPTTPKETIKQDVVDSVLKKTREIAGRIMDKTDKAFRTEAEVKEAIDKVMAFFNKNNNTSVTKIEDLPLGDLRSWEAKLDSKLKESNDG